MLAIERLCWYDITSKLIGADGRHEYLMVAIDMVPTVGTRVVMCVLFFVLFTLYVTDRERKL